MEELIKELKSDNPCVRLSAIMRCMDINDLKEEEIYALKLMKNDNRILAGRTIGEIATAVLHCKRLESYIGDNRNITDLIRDLM